MSDTLTNALTAAYEMKCEKIYTPTFFLYM
jgi:hypothetical protein